MNVLLLVPGFPKDAADTTCLPYLQSYLKALKREYPDVQPVVISFHYPYHSQPYEWNGIMVYPINGRNKGWWMKPLLWMRIIHTIYVLHKKTSFRAIHSFWASETALIGNIFHWKTRIPHIITLMGQDVLPQNPYLRLMQIGTPLWVALNERHAQSFTQSTGKEVNIRIPWGIDPTEFPAGEERTIDLLGVGSLSSLKNYNAFIEIVREIYPIFPKLQCEIIGDGPERAPLQHKIQRYGLNDCIRLRGALPREEVLQTMAKSKILLHPSTYESFGYVFSEALYSGMYGVSLSVGNAKENERWAISTEVEGMKEKVIHLLSAPLSFDRQAVYTSSECANAYHLLYKSIQ